MAFSFGFFNSKNLDRTYTAENFCDYLGSIICNGIQDNYGDCFKLTAALTGLKVTVGKGKAWIDGHYFINDARYSIDLTEYQDESLPRYVAIAIILDTSESGRNVSLKLYPGTPAENPTLPTIPTDAEHTRLLLYNVRLNVGATSLTEADWFDHREDYNVCGYVRCILGKCKVTELLEAYTESNQLIEDLQAQIAELEERVSSITGQIVDMGQIGDSVFYTQYSDGLLSITGTGETNDYTGFAVQFGYTDDPDSPLYENMDIHQLRMATGITRLGNWLLAGCRNLTDVILPKSIESIGNLTFNRTGIKTIVLPPSLTTIGTAAFCAAKLESIYIPATLKTFSDYAFFHCESLNTVNIQCERIGATAFSSCTALTDVTIGVGCTRIGNSAFVYCAALQEIKYEGTLEQWEAVQKGHLWDGHGGTSPSESGLVKIICTDGFMEYDTETHEWKVGEA